MWRWGASALADAVLTGTPGSAIASIAGASLRNAVRDPAALWRIGELTGPRICVPKPSRSSTAAYRPQLVWSSGDTFISRASFESLRTALREPQVHRVAGCHGWLIGDPDGFGRAMGSVLLSTTSAAA